MSFSTALLNGNGNGMRAAVKSFEKISEIFGNLASLANFVGNHLKTQFSEFLP